MGNHRTKLAAGPSHKVEDGTMCRMPSPPAQLLGTQLSMPRPDALQSTMAAHVAAQQHAEAVAENEVEFYAWSAKNFDNWYESVADAVVSKDAVGPRVNDARSVLKTSPIIRALQKEFGALGKWYFTQDGK